MASDAADGAITKELALITRYPPGSARLLVKRSKAKAFKEFWHDSLEDADQVKIFSASDSPECTTFAGNRYG